jgi:ABC-2 type transport system ATP-binding protein
LHLAGLGKTLLVTSHILPELSRICDRVAIMTHGKLRAFGTIEEIGRQISQQRTIEVQLTSLDQISAAAEIIRAAIEPGAEVVESVTEQTVRFRTAIAEVELGRLLATLVQHQILVTQFRELQTDLEEAFMSFARPAERQPELAVAAGGSRS